MIPHGKGGGPNVSSVVVGADGGQVGAVIKCQPIADVSAVPVMGRVVRLKVHGCMSPRQWSASAA